ncbi:MAG TPA: NAD(P)H-hydrate dehydratase [bacterium]|mgnify:CR=1 FL=1|nr:NAD(P)H-hydrate dehydratase [bacterium]
MEISNATLIREIDKYTVEKLGIPGIILMEQAASGCADEIIKILAEKKFDRIIIAAGSGNNGGDGFAICRRLLYHGFNCEILLACSESKIKGDALTNLIILKNLGIRISQFSADNFDASYLDKSIIIDAILGTGATGNIKPEISKLINQINLSNCFKVSIDLPSGLSENPENPVVKSDMTLTIGLYKDILFSDKGIENCGTIKLVNIDFFESVISRFSRKTFANEISKQFLIDLIPPENSNKHSAGKILIAAGSEKYSGAAVLACKAAVESGAGLVYCLCEETTLNCVKINVPEVITVKLDSDEGIINFSEFNKRTVEKYLNAADSILIGPGLGTSLDLFELVKFVMIKSTVPVVIDADGLNNIAGKIDFKYINENGTFILTPHPGEFSRLTGLNKTQIQNDRINSIDALKLNKNSIIVLKGKYSIISDSENKYVNFTGNSLLSTAGSGDVLAGIIAAYCARAKKYETLETVRTAAFIHGAVSDYLKNFESRNSMKAADIVSKLNKITALMISSDDKKILNPF